MLLYALAIVFVGQGIASLQEASVVKATFVRFVPTIQALGIFPTVQTLAAQVLLFAVLGGGVHCAAMAREPGRTGPESGRQNEKGPAHRAGPDHAIALFRP